MTSVKGRVASVTLVGLEHAGAFFGVLRVEPRGRIEVDGPEILLEELEAGIAKGAAAAAAEERGMDGSEPDLQRRRKSRTGHGLCADHQWETDEHGSQTAKHSYSSSKEMVFDYAACRRSSVARRLRSRIPPTPAVVKAATCRAPS
jgi:hypothetical protein